VIITRVAKDQIKAFINSCTHRGTRLLGEEGPGLRAIVSTARSMAGRGISMAP
jgi:phenylpropionate dioxygenase-like ring-hydroxylating dioxygenase large terminal subunit